MKKIIFFIVIFLLFISLIPSYLEKGIPNSFYAYLIYIKDFSLENYFSFILGFIILIVVFLCITKFDKKHSFRKNFLLSFAQIINVLIASLFISYVLLLFIAFIQLNLFSILINIDPRILKISTDKSDIINTLEINNYPPKIITCEDDQNKELVEITKSIAGTNTFYGSYILSSIPDFIILPIKESGSSIILVDNNLIITKLDANVLRDVSPTVSYLFVQKYFSDRIIKSDPEILIMDESEYQALRKYDFEKGLFEVDSAINKYKKQIASSSGSITEDENKLAYNKTASENANAEYKKCLANGNYTLSYCKNTLSKRQAFLLSKEELDELEEKLISEQKLLKESEEYYDLYLQLREQVEAVEGTIQQEFGAFTPANTIKIAFNTKSSHTISDYFGTLAHEYLHYASYISEDKKFKDDFIEEGLTEYFARQTIKGNLDKSSNLGYPLFVKILEQMTKRILERDLEGIYFSKDQDALEKMLDRVYGENFYEDNRLLFLKLQYVSDKKEVLEVANELMHKIGGKPFSEKDILSTHTSL